MEGFALWAQARARDLSRIVGSRAFKEHLADVDQLLQPGFLRGVQWRLQQSVWDACKFIWLIFDRDGTRPDPDKVEQLKEWPEEAGMDDAMPLMAFAGYLKEFIPHLQGVVAPLKPYRKTGAALEDLKRNPEALKPLQALRRAEATDTPLVNQDFDAAASYLSSGRPFERHADGSDSVWSCVLAQRETIHGTPRPVAAVASKSLLEGQQRWMLMGREAPVMYKGVLEFERYRKG